MLSVVYVLHTAYHGVFLFHCLPPITSLTCTLDQIPAPSSVVETSIKFPTQTVHLDLSVGEHLKTYVPPPAPPQEYIPPQKTYSPPSQDLKPRPVKAPRLELDPVYLPPQVPPPVDRLLPERDGRDDPLNTLYSGPLSSVYGASDIDMGNTKHVLVVSMTLA